MKEIVFFQDEAEVKTENVVSRNKNSIWIENNFGNLHVEPRGFKGDKGLLIYAEFKDVDKMPPNHIALTSTETMHLIKWLVGYLNDIEIPETVGTGEDI